MAYAYNHRMDSCIEIMHECEPCATYSEHICLILACIALCQRDELVLIFAVR